MPRRLTVEADDHKLRARPAGAAEMAAGSEDGGDEDGAEGGQSAASMKAVVTGSASDSEMDNGMRRASRAIAMLVSSVVPKPVEFIDTKQDDSKQRSVIDMDVPMDETEQVEAIERGPKEHIVP